MTRVWLTDIEQQMLQERRFLRSNLLNVHRLTLPHVLVSSRGELHANLILQRDEVPRTY